MRGFSGVLLWFMAVLPVVAEASSSIVISQVYGGGGNSGAVYKSDFIELFNRSSSPVSVEGWTVQYAASTGTTWSAIQLSGTIAPGQYYLIAAAMGAGGSVDLPPSQANGQISLSATTGKVALVSSSGLLSGACPIGFVDLVGYGSANCAEGTTASGTGNTTAVTRRANGCTDSDNNSTDFTTATPNPRNAATAINICSTTPAVTVGGASLNFPHYVQGAGYQTSFTFTNLSDVPSAITLNVYSQSGAGVANTTIAMPALGASTVAMAGSDFTVGWARATASPPIDLVGTETIQLFNSSGALVMEASVLPAQLDTRLRVPVYERDGFGTGVAFINPGPTASTVTMQLRGSDGGVVLSSPLSLAPSQQTAKFVSELFPGIVPFEGTLELVAPTPLAAIGVRQHASGIFSTVPVSPTPPQVFFSPGGRTASQIVTEINQARRPSTLLSTLSHAMKSPMH